MCRLSRHIFYALVLEPTTTGAASVSATAIVAVIGGAINTMISEAAPENDEYSGSDNGTDKRHACQARLTGDRKVEQAHYNEDRQKSQNNSANNAIGRAPMGN